MKPEAFRRMLAACLALGLALLACQATTVTVPPTATASAAATGMIVIYTRTPAPTQTPIPTETSTPTVTPTPTATPNPLDSLKRVCLRMDKTNNVAENPAPAVQRLLEAMGLEVIRSGDECDAVLELEIHDQPLSAEYRDSLTEKYRTCFTGVQYDGSLRVTPKDGSTRSQPIQHRVGPEGGTIYSCPSQGAARSGHLHAMYRAILDGMYALWGEGVLAAGIQVDKFELEAATSAGWMGAEVLSPAMGPPLLALLDHRNPETRRDAAWLVLNVEPPPAESLALLAQHAAKERDPEAYKMFVRAISTLLSEAADGAEVDSATRAATTAVMVAALKNNGSHQISGEGEGNFPCSTRT